MGITTVQATIMDLSKKISVSDEFLVDTGSSYTVIPNKMADQLGLKSTKSQKFSLADGTTIQRNLSSAIVKLDGNEAATTVVIGQKDDSPILGVITLEGMGLMVDPFKRKLLPMKLLFG